MGGICEAIECANELRRVLGCLGENFACDIENDKRRYGTLSGWLKVMKIFTNSEEDHVRARVGQGVVGEKLRFLELN